MNRILCMYTIERRTKFEFFKSPQSFIAKEPRFYVELKEFLRYIVHINLRSFVPAEALNFYHSHLGNYIKSAWKWLSSKTSFVGGSRFFSLSHAERMRKNGNSPPNIDLEFWHWHQHFITHLGHGNQSFLSNSYGNPFIINFNIRNTHLDHRQLSSLPVSRFSKSIYTKSPTSTASVPIKPDTKKKPSPNTPYNKNYLLPLNHA